MQLTDLSHIPNIVKLLTDKGLCKENYSFVKAVSVIDEELIFSEFCTRILKRNEQYIINLLN